MNIKNTRIENNTSQMIQWLLKDQKILLSIKTKLPHKRFKKQNLAKYIALELGFYCNVLKESELPIKLDELPYVDFDFVAERILEKEKIASPLCPICNGYGYIEVMSANGSPLRYKCLYCKN